MKSCLSQLELIDESLPELGGAQLAGAAAAGLDEQGPPGDEEEDDRQHEGQQRRDDVVKVAAALQVLAILAADVHAHLKGDRGIHWKLEWIGNTVGRLSGCIR